MRNEFLRQGPGARFAFIRSEKGSYPLTLMCQVMQVRCSGYYAFCRRVPSQRARTEARLRVHVRAAFFTSHRRYVSPRVHAEFRAHGIRASKKRAARLTQQDQLVAHKRRRSQKTTDSGHTLPVAPT